ncbi:alpha-isopropylmalate synthase regulatory domain-containing protein [Thermodesulforhabdus norvegica]|uniref:2-isopropylmalate synthase n=1 Tax=Thermodesulforhabdus norvegica TaxID=39841 RepID=A0A1I4SKQ5_9BACT|nr:alpha-isopropylmalate synthase regulatory domain-containing protein [Thermodesulforhabdus norvegica]SFM65019.1 2-isopropylmalate synthase [Thermodesulforhabdus norvegica]
MKHVAFLDTTLRDGIKIPGLMLLPEEKIQIARQIATLGVDILEGGFPAASEEQYRTLCVMAEEIQGPSFCVLARATNPEDFRIARDVLKRHPKPRIHTFIPASAAYRDHFLKKPLDECLRIAVEAVKRGKDVADHVEFSFVDAFRASENELLKLLDAVLEAGADTITFADTVGYATPWLIENIIGKICSEIKDEIVVGIHCHNDLGLATPNSIAALRAGASLVHCTVNGLGERAGNARLEEIATIIAIHGKALGLSTSVAMDRIGPVCRLLERHTGISFGPLKPLTGSYAFYCEPSGPQIGDVAELPPCFVIREEDIGMVKNGEPMDQDTPFEVFKARVKELGYVLKEGEYQRCYETFQRLASKKENIFNSDLELIVRQALFHVPQKYRLLYLNVSAGSIPVPHATVQLEIDGQVVQDAGFGHGPVDAAFKTIFRMVRRFPKLIHYEVKAATLGTDAQGMVLLRVQEGDTIVDGWGAHVDIVLASAQALIDALNKLEHYGGRREVSEYTDDEAWSIVL